MKQINKLVFMATLFLMPFSLFSGRGGFGSSFGGGFLGGFSGSLIGNAVSQPRQQRQPRGECGYYQQPTQTRVVEVHRPTYVVHEVVHEGPTRAERQYQQEVREQEDRIRQQRLREIREQSEAQIAVSQQSKATSVEQRLNKIENELAKTTAENEQLKAELKRLQTKPKK
jgi:predicted RNase H-like nuclease (RuvC/YqgF family)